MHTIGMEVVTCSTGHITFSTGALTKTIVATKERLEGVGGREEGEGGEGIPGAITPAQRKREMEIVKKEVKTL